MPKTTASKRAMSKAREGQLRAFIRELSDICKRRGFRIEPLESYGTLAVYDEREERPADFPVAAFAKSIGKEAKGLDVRAILPDTSRG